MFSRAVAEVGGLSLKGAHEMAGDWIKMRMDLADDPAVIYISTKLGIGEDDAVGKLHKLWCWADRHTTDGKAPGITSRWVDKYVGAQGFADAMCAAGWISFNESGVDFPNFDRHNGRSAKARCEATIRQRLSRKNRDDGDAGVTRTNIPRPFVRAVFHRDQFTCAYCGEQSDEKREGWKKAILSVDHIVPASRGGRSSMDNLLTCCKKCNIEKNDRTPEEWGVLPQFLADGVTYVSQKICDAGVTKALPEKRREEKKETKAASAFSLPEWVPESEWLEFVKMRAKRWPLTEEGKRLAVRELEKLRDGGHDPAAVLSWSVLNSYRGLFPPKSQPEKKDDFAGMLHG